MKKILLVLIFSILFSSNAFSSNKFYIFEADIPGSKDSSLCAFDGDQKRYNKSTSTYLKYGSYGYSNCYWTLHFTGSVKVEMNYINSKYGTTSTAFYKGKATNFANNHKSSYPDFVLNKTNGIFKWNKTNGVGNEKAPQTIYVFSEKSVVVAERERLKNTPKLAETKTIEEKKVVTSNNIASDLWNDDPRTICLRATKIDGSDWRGSNSMDYIYVKEAQRRNIELATCNVLADRGNSVIERTGERIADYNKEKMKNLVFCKDEIGHTYNMSISIGCWSGNVRIDKAEYCNSGTMGWGIRSTFQDVDMLCLNSNQYAALQQKEKPIVVNNEETKKQIATPIIKPEPEVITTNEETMVASAVEPQLARIGEAEFGFKCEWMHWNSKGSASYNACIDTYVNADKAEQEELRLAKVEAENQAQQAKLLEDRMNEMDRMYGTTCKAMGLNKNNDEFPKCMMEMMKIEQEKEQAKIQNELAMAQIQLQQAQLEAQNKAMELRLAELENNNELIREASIRSQKAEAERSRQQQALYKQRVALQEKKDKQQGWMNALMALNALQPKTQPSSGFFNTMPTRTVCSWQYSQYVCNTR